MIRFLIEKEFKLILRHPFLPKLIFVMPILMLCILPFAANMEVKNINLSIVDNDRSVSSAKLTEKIVSSGFFRLVDVDQSYQAAFENVEQGDADIILNIPPNFGRDIKSGLSPQVSVAANSVNAVKAGMGSNYLMSIIQEYGVAETANKIYPTVRVAPQYRFNPRQDYKFFMVPALMVMLMTIMCGFLPALNIVGEKESGTIEQMNVTPVGKIQFIIAKVIPYWIIGYVVLTIGFGVAYFVYGIVAVGSYMSIYVSAFLFILTVSGLGLVISNHSATMQQAMFVMFFFLLIMILLSGLFTPVQSMPDWAQSITIFNPLKYFINIMRGVYLKGSTLGDMLLPLSALGGFAVVLNTWAILSYRKQG